MSKDKIHVRYVSGPIGEMNKGLVFGGTAATNYVIKKAFSTSTEIDLEIKARHEFNTISEIDEWLKNCDVSWCDETSILQLMYVSHCKRPDIVGPIARSPVKRYNGGSYEAVYNTTWFYDGIVLRLNEAEERPSCLKETIPQDIDWVSKVSFIRHAIDLEEWKPNDLIVNKKYVLWAGMKSRDAKNFPMFAMIRAMTVLPEGYEWKVLNKYSIDSYKMVLDDTAILVNTSKYESFCNAVNEARAKGVCTLVRKDFNGDYMFKDQPIQVEYTPQAYSKKILEILSDEITPITLGEEAYDWAKKNISLDVMRDDITKFIKQAYEKNISNNTSKE